MLGTSRKNYVDGEAATWKIKLRRFREELRTAHNAMRDIDGRSREAFQITGRQENFYQSVRYYLIPGMSPVQGPTFTPSAPR
jgi:hypothetical protein